MGLWRDLNGDGNFQPGGADGAAFMTCVTAANGACDFTGLAEGAYWVQEVSPPAGGDLECHPRLGSGFELGGEQPPCRTRPSGMETPPQPSASLVPTTRTASRSSWTAAPATSRSTDDFANRRTNPSIGDVTCQGLFRIVLVLDRSGSIQTQRRGRLQERRHRLRQRPRGHQHRGRDRVLRGELLARGGLHQRPRRPIGVADQRDQQRLQQHGRRHQLGCRPVRGQCPVHRRLQTSSSWSRTATPR